LLIDDLEQEHRVISFVDSGKTEQSDLFRFLQEYAIHPDYYIDFTEQVAKNVIAVSHEYFLRLDREKRIHFLLSVCKLLDFALSIKLWEFQLGSKDTPKQWANFPLYFGMVVQAVEPLQSLRRELGYLEPVFTRKLVCLEGETESMFIRTLQLGTRSSWLDFSTYTYAGKGEVMHLVHLINDNSLKGTRVNLSYDSDGKSEAFLNKLKQYCHLDRVFGFKRDFEASFPPEILANAIKAYDDRYSKKRVNITPDQVAALLKEKAAFLYAAGKQLGIEFNKPKLGAILAEQIAPEIDEFWSQIMNDEASDMFQRFEIHGFLKFLAFN
jgi:hypothetical protein